MNRVVRGEARVLARYDSLEDQLHASRVPDAFHIVPAELQAIFAIQSADRANPCDRIARLDPGDLGKIVVAAGTALIGSAVDVTHPTTLHPFRAYPLRTPVTAAP